MLRVMRIIKDELKKKREKIRPVDSQQKRWYSRSPIMLGSAPDNSRDFAGR